MLELHAPKRRSCSSEGRGRVRANLIKLSLDCWGRLISPRGKAYASCRSHSFSEEKHGHVPLSICKHFARLRDPRLNRRKRHLLPDILVIAIWAVICGANNFPPIEAFGKHRRDWLAKFLALPNGVPSHDTFERVFQRLCPDAIQCCFLAWLR